MVSEKVQIAVCICGLIIFGAVLPILIPLAAIYYESVYFIVLMTSIQFTIIFAIAYFSVHKMKPHLPNHKMTIFLSGVFSAAMSLFKVYASHPERTPPVMQSILAGLAIVPNVIFTKVILKKNVVYVKKFIIPSLILLAASLGISVIPLTSSWDPMSILWITLYLIGVVARSLYCIMQEKYLTDSKDGSVKNKVTIMFYTRVVHMVVILPFFWLEYVIGYTNAPFTALGNSFVEFFTKLREGWMLEGFILAYLVFYVFSVYLNSISSNYNMVASVAINPAVGIFFTIFESLNPGIKYPWYIVVPALICSVGSIILWIIGEKSKRDDYVDLDKKIVNGEPAV